jgi:hypothetical protein
MYALIYTCVYIYVYTLIVILLVVLCGCETWSLTLRKKHRLRVFENRVLRKILGPKRDEVKGVMRRLHNEELFTPHQILFGRQSQEEWEWRGM